MKKGLFCKKNERIDMNVTIYTEISHPISR